MLWKLFVWSFPPLLLCLPFDFVFSDAVAQCACLEMAIYPFELVSFGLHVAVALLHAFFVLAEETRPDRKAALMANLQRLFS